MTLDILSVKIKQVYKTNLSMTFHVTRLSFLASSGGLVHGHIMSWQGDQVMEGLMCHTALCRPCPDRSRGAMKRFHVGKW